MNKNNLIYSNLYKKYIKFFFVIFLFACNCDDGEKIFFSSTYDNKEFIERRIKKLNFNIPLYTTWVNNNREFQEIIKSGKVTVIFVKKGHQDNLIKKINLLKLKEIKELEIKGTFYSLVEDNEFNENVKKVLNDF